MVTRCCGFQDGIFLKESSLEPIMLTLLMHTQNNWPPRGPGRGDSERGRGTGERGLGKRERGERGEREREREGGKGGREREREGQRGRSR